MAKKKNVKKQSNFVRFGAAISRFFGRYGDFYGCASRSEYWFGRLFKACVFTGLLFLSYFTFILLIVDELAFASVMSVLGALVAVWYMIILVPSLAVVARRCHDVGMSGWAVNGPVLFTFVMLVFGVLVDCPPCALVGVMCFVAARVWQLVVMCRGSNRVDNPYCDE